nr:MAG TPA: Baseplate J like protein [Caudoviricetes sp.]
MGGTAWAGCRLCGCRTSAPPIRGAENGRPCNRGQKFHLQHPRAALVRIFYDCNDLRRHRGQHGGEHCMIDFSNAQYQSILTYMLSQISDDYDKRDTSPIPTAVSPAAYVFEGFFISLNMVQRQAFFQTATGESLDLLAPLASVSRKQATAAIRKGEFDTAIPIGSRFSTINGSDSINFIAVSTLGAGHTYRLQAETPGSIGNAYSGPILPIDTIQGLSSARISDILVPGDDTETDTELRARILAALNSRAFGGNVAQYVEEIEKLDGVGAVQVYPTWKGGGTVLCSVLGADWLPASSDLVQTIQNAIDPVPNSGQGLGLAPIGAKVTISAPEKLEVSVSAAITLAPGYSLETVQSAVRASFDAYLLNVRKSWAVNVSQMGLAYSASVYVARISAAIIMAEGVVNVTDVQLNGEPTDLFLTETGTLQQIPVTGTVTLHEA